MRLLCSPSTRIWQLASLATLLGAATAFQMPGRVYMTGSDDRSYTKSSQKLENADRRDYLGVAGLGLAGAGSSCLNPPLDATANVSL